MWVVRQPTFDTAPGPAVYKKSSRRLRRLFQDSGITRALDAARITMTRGEV